MRQVNGANGKGERRGFLEDITCFGKRGSRGNGSGGKEEERKREREKDGEKVDVGRCHEDKRVRNAITAYFTAPP